MRDLSRLLRPRSVAVIGGGAWCQSVVEQLLKGGFDGDIWPVHPRASEICGLPAFDGVPNLPGVPDAAFVGINRDATVGAVERLRKRGAGGAVCFASGFAEVADGDDRNAALLKAAGDMPILGPNCYGMINALDGALLWPDQHGCVPVERGVAILTQSSNIAINLTMQGRGLPIAYVVTTGNQAQISQAAAAMALLDDPRVTAIGLHVEGFGDLSEWQALARAAAAKGVPIVALKVGRSAQARAATVSHTASIAGADAGAGALLARLGIARADSLAVFLETLKLLHVAGPLPHRRIASISCSGGEASLMADLGETLGVTYPPLDAGQTQRLATALGPKVALANPLDYHTYIWRDLGAMTKAFSAMAAPGLAMICLVVDFPRADRCDPADWECAIEAAIETRAQTGVPVAMIASLPELMPEDVAERLISGGVVPLCGMVEGLSAIALAHVATTPDLGTDLPVLGPEREGRILGEAEAKTDLAAFGVAVPKTVSIADDVAAACEALSPPYVLKGTGFAHKSEAGAVVLGLRSAEAVTEAMAGMSAEGYLLEEMITGGSVELLVGVTRDPAHGFVLTLAAGGTLTELWADSCSLLVPASDAAVEAALSQLKIAPLLDGFRGSPAVDMARVLEAVRGVQDYVLAHAESVSEVEINPLICTADRAVAADALIRKADD